jgi:hypothetical protein
MAMRYTRRDIPARRETRPTRTAAKEAPVSSVTKAATVVPRLRVQMETAVQEGGAVIAEQTPLLAMLLVLGQAELAAKELAQDLVVPAVAVAIQYSIRQKKPEKAATVVPRAAMAAQAVKAGLAATVPTVAHRVAKVETEVMAEAAETSEDAAAEKAVMEERAGIAFLPEQVARAVMEERVV